jgi:hypothetical protein
MTDKCRHCKIDLPSTHSGPCPNCGKTGKILPLKVKDSVLVLESVVSARKFDKAIQPKGDISTPVAPGITEIPFLLREIDFHILTAKFAVSMVSATFFGITATLGIKLISKYTQNFYIATYEIIECVVSGLIFGITCLPSFINYWKKKRPVLKDIESHFKGQKESIDEQRKKYGRL